MQLEDADAVVTHERRARLDNVATCTRLRVTDLRQWWDTYADMSLKENIKLESYFKTEKGQVTGKKNSK